MPVASAPRDVTYRPLGITLDVAMGIVLLVHVIGLYVFVYLPIGGELLLPAGYCILTAAILWLRNAKGVSWRLLWPLALMLAVGGLSIAVQPDLEVQLGNRLRSLLLLMYSFFLTVPIYLEGRRLSPAVALRSIDVLLGMFLIGVVLEHTTPLRELSNAFRAAFFDEWRLYSADERDLMVAGMIRPKLFGSEPSYLGLFVTTLLSARLVLDHGIRGYLLAGAGFVCAIALIGSPTLIAWPLTATVMLLVDLRRRWAARMVTIDNLIGVIIAGFVALALGIGVYFAFTDRLNAVVSGDDQSLAMRLTSPWQVAMDALSKNPWFGGGIGGDEALAGSIINANWRSSTAALVEERPGSFTGAVVVNIVLFQGILGATMVLIALTAMATMTGPFGIYGLAFACISSFLLGGYTSPRWWLYVFVVLAASEIGGRGRA